MNGQNHIIAITPFEFHPVKEFEKRQKSIDIFTVKALQITMDAKKTTVYESKKKSKKLQDSGKIAMEHKKYKEAEEIFSQAIELNPSFGTLWTQRATCRTFLKKYEEAISDLEYVLSFNPKCTQSIIQKGNIHLELRQFDEATILFESLRQLGESKSADACLKKLKDVQELDLSKFGVYILFLMLVSDPSSCFKCSDRAKEKRKWQNGHKIKSN